MLFFCCSHNDVTDILSVTRHTVSHYVNSHISTQHTASVLLSLELLFGRLGSRVVSVLDSGAEGPGFKSQPRRCRASLRQTVHTHRASVHQAVKLAAALLRVVKVTAGLAESNGSIPPGLWLTSPAGWLPRTGISSRTLRLEIEYGLAFYCLSESVFSVVLYCRQTILIFADFVWISWCE